ncbi:Protein SET [Choanephora cucurbitarum]|uniref:Protein SET n=1 Tax=Choanephora cucurbitarum TaxID=101091 RepID=A0A1C7MWT7_9FUNG|nr:Protein SET [Choanephora cucurbitarum]
MSVEDSISDDFAVLQEETIEAIQQVEAYQRKLMAPIYHKRREIAKKIPHFWSQSLGNSPLFAFEPSDNDVEALENLTELHVEYDDSKPNYRKVVATFKKNDLFKNETLTKEFSIDPEDEGSVISKTTIEYHESKDSKKRKSREDDEDDATFLEWFGNDDVRSGILITEDFFPNALDYYKGDEESGDEIDDDIELGSEDDEDDEDEHIQKKKK